jgi:hypothetical protein
MALDLSTTAQRLSSIRMHACEPYLIRSAGPRSRFDCFAGTRRVYQRYLLHCGRLAASPPTPFSELRRELSGFQVHMVVGATCAH